MAPREMAAELSIPPVRRLIVNADDFGLSTSVNAAVIRAHREGILTTASLMVNEAGFDEAVANIKATLIAKPQKVATRRASQIVLESLTAAVPSCSTA